MDGPFPVGGVGLDKRRKKVPRQSDRGVVSVARDIGPAICRSFFNVEFKGSRPAPHRRHRTKLSPRPAFARNTTTAPQLRSAPTPATEQQERSQQLGDDKSLSEHLKLPIQRINDYQLLLKWELVRQPTPPGKLPDHSKLSILACLLSTDVNKKLEADFLFGFERLGNCCV
uniref:DH domain-containing protein n=1 Tax=Timema shepardi TaxID=629360 RepID=A0A7R9G4S3_TIMSH|nr:unnamed protein product [Timema shepardi]